MPDALPDALRHNACVDEISIHAIQDAARRISPHLHRTPVHTCEAINSMSGRQVFFKCELFQKTGSFKVRGACNAAMLAPDSCRDLVAHSSGNHAQALAWAAKLRGIKAHVVMPKDSSAVKVAAVRGYGASVTMCEPSSCSRVKTADNIISSLPGAILVHPSNDPRVICGQGTVGLELMEQLKEIIGTAPDAVIVPIGGGGLIGGIATAIKALSPSTLVIGAEPEEVDDAFRSKESGTLQGHDGVGDPETVADGLRTTLGSNTWPIVRDYVDEIVVVSEADIKKYMRVVYERMKLVIEPSTAVGVAALMSKRVQEKPPELQTIGVILCGGNVDVSALGVLMGNASTSVP